MVLYDFKQIFSSVYAVHNIVYAYIGTDSVWSLNVVSRLEMYCRYE